MEFLKKLTTEHALKLDFIGSLQFKVQVSIRPVCDPRTLALLSDAFDEHMALVRVADQETFDICLLNTSLKKFLYCNYLLNYLCLFVFHPHTNDFHSFTTSYEL